MRRRWRVQAILLAEHTGTDEDYPYGPRYFRTRWAATRFVYRLRSGFAGQARVEMEQVVQVRTPPA